MPNIDPALLLEMQAVYHKARKEFKTPEGKIDIEKSLEHNSKIANDLREKYLGKFISEGEKTGKFPVAYLATINAFSEHFNERVENAISGLDYQKHEDLQKYKIQSKYYKTKDENGHQVFESSIAHGGNHAVHLYSSERKNLFASVKGGLEYITPWSNNLDDMKREAIKIIMDGVITPGEENVLKKLSEKSNEYNIAIINSKNHEGKPQKEIFIYEEGRGKEAYSYSVGKPYDISPIPLNGISLGSEDSKNKPAPVQDLHSVKGKY